MPTATANISSLQVIQGFLDELKTVLASGDFNLKTDLDILYKKRNEDPIDPYTTGNTLISLDFNAEDVKNQLLRLEVSDYYETVSDNKDCNLPPFYAFIKSIKEHEVYIKVKIRDATNKKVFCVSFHFARYPCINLPYGK